MSRPFVLAHVSDLHVSNFGDTFHDLRHVVKRSARVADTADGRWETVWSENGWRVLHARGGRASKITLIDPDGYAHPIPAKKKGEGSDAPVPVATTSLVPEAAASATDLALVVGSGGKGAAVKEAIVDAVDRAVARARLLEAGRAVTLAKTGRATAALGAKLAAAPWNANLRLLRAACSLDPALVDAVLVTGDLTDDGAGYELVEAAFAPWAERGRLFAVPGNHDLYLFPLAGSSRPKPNALQKRASWGAFAARLGLLREGSPGPWVRELPDAGAIVVGLDSCARPQRRFFRHNGAIGEGQLGFLRELSTHDAWKRARHRLVALHHHVVPLPHGIGRRAASEVGMRLDDAKTVAAVLEEIGATLVLHGHRHVSEQRQPAGASFRILASPSFTLGCRSGDGPSYWRIELGERAHVERARMPLDAAEQENDPGTEPTTEEPA